MIDERIRNVIVNIIDQELDRYSANWSNIEAEALATISYINDNSVEVDNRIYQFLEDADVRRKSPLYAQRQTDDVLTLIS